MNLCQSWGGKRISMNNWKGPQFLVDWVLFVSGLVCHCMLVIHWLEVCVRRTGLRLYTLSKQSNVVSVRTGLSLYTGVTVTVAAPLVTAGRLVFHCSLANCLFHFLVIEEKYAHVICCRYHGYGDSRLHHCPFLNRVSRLCIDRDNSDLISSNALLKTRRI